MNKVFEKILERLEELHERYINQYGAVSGNPMAFSVKECIDTVLEIAEQYNNGWISVKETLPEKEGSYLVIGKSGGAFVTRWYKPSEFHPNGHFGGNCSDYIRYWMPRPEQPQPYQPKGEING